MKLFTALLFVFLVGCATTSQPEEAASDEHTEDTSLAVIFSILGGYLGAFDADSD